MAAKDELITRLGELGKVLGRELSTQGSVTDLQLRVREAEEEIEAVADNGVDGTGGDAGTDRAHLLPGDLLPGDLILPSEGEIEWVTVRALTTLHINALHKTRDQLVRLVYADDIVRVSVSDAKNLGSAGHVRSV
ncbi:TPA: DNA-packaging protein FI [Serratia marcescens]|nr:DNA-packaging protein FI [Serratia marcescens]